MLNAPKVQGEAKKSAFEKEMTETEVTAIFNACYEYKTLKKGARPQVDGNDLSDKEISKIANAFKTISERVRYTQTTASIEKSFYSLSNNNMSIIEKAKADKVAETVTPVVETVAEPVAEVVAEETPVVEATPVVHGVETVEKSNTDGAEDVTPVVAEEAGNDSSLNNTVSEVVAEEAPVVEATPVIEAPKVEEPIAVSEPVISEEAILEKAKSLFDSAIAEAIAPIAIQLASIAKSLENAETLTKSKDETAQKNNELIAKSIETMAKGYEALNTQVHNMNSSVAFRKSSAVVIEKKDSGSEPDLSTPEGFNKAVLAEMEVNGGNFAFARKSVLSRANA